MTAFLALNVVLVGTHCVAFAVDGGNPATVRRVALALAAQAVADVAFVVAFVVAFGLPS